MEIQFFRSQTYALWMSFDIYVHVVTYRVINFLPKLVDMLYIIFNGKKTEFPFFVFPYFRVLPPWKNTSLLGGFITSSECGVGRP